jgi:hypothetical protein
MRGTSDRGVPRIVLTAQLFPIARSNPSAIWWITAYDLPQLGLSGFPFLIPSR